MMEGILFLVLVIVVMSILVFYGLTRPPGPPDDVYKLSVFDKLHDNGDVLESSKYYVSGFDVNQTKVVLHLDDVNDYMKTKVNSTNTYTCSHGSKIFCDIE